MYTQENDNIVISYNGRDVIKIYKSPSITDKHRVIELYSAYDGKYLGKNYIHACGYNGEPLTYDYVLTRCKEILPEVWVDNTLSRKEVASIELTSEQLAILINTILPNDVKLSHLRNTYANIERYNPDYLPFWVDLLKHELYYKKLIQFSKITRDARDALDKLQNIFELPLLFFVDAPDSIKLYSSENKSTYNYISYTSSKTFLELPNPYYELGLQHIDAYIKVIIKEDESNTNKLELLPLESIYPNIDKLKKELLTNYDAIKLTFNSYKKENNSITIPFSYAFLKGAISYKRYYEMFKSFNTLKNIYMLCGFSEEEAVKQIIKTTGKLSEDNLFRSFGVCNITKQYLPSIFLLENKDSYISLIYLYLHSSLYNEKTLYKFTEMPVVEDNKKYMQVEELKATTQTYYDVSVFNHSRNALEYLSIRKNPKEITTITNKESLYNPTPYMGIELEIEHKDDIQIPEKTNTIKSTLDTLGRDYVILKKDGSLRGKFPFEIVTVPATLSYHKERWKDFLSSEKPKKYLKSFTSGNCGMHVHINRKSFTGLHLVKFMKFINSQDNFDFMTKVAQRAHNKYSEYLTGLKQTGGFAKYISSATSKYTAVNTKPSDTIEVRIFRGNIAKVGFLKNLEFVHAAWAFTKDAPLTALTYKEFMFWLFNPKNNTKEYKELKLWLSSSNWYVDGIVIRKTDSLKLKQLKEEKRKILLKARKIQREKFDVENSKVYKAEKFPQELKLTKDLITSVA